jgi:hypothetical protein
MAACIYNERLRITKDGSSYRPTASIPPRPRFAGGLRACSRARFNPYGGQRKILRFLRRNRRMVDRGRACPVAARNGAPVCRNAVRRRESFSGGGNLPRGPQPGRGGCQDHSVVGAANVVRASRFAPKTAPRSTAEVQTGISSMFGSGVDGTSSLRRKAARAPFDNPSLSWNMIGARSLDCARG